MSWWALGAAGLNMVGGALNAYWNNKNVDKTIAANRELAEYQYNKDVEMWNRKNQYDSPQMQMERLKAAGLNPHLVYGNGATATSGTMPQYNAPRVDYNYKPPVDIQSTLQAYQNAELMDAQIDNVRQDTKKKEIEGVIGLLDQGIKGSESEIRAAWAKVAPILAQLEVQNKEGANTQQAAQTRAINLENELKKVELKWNKEGMTKTDALYLRMLIKSAQDMGIDISSSLSGLGENFQEALKSAMKGWIDLDKIIKKQPKKGG